MLAHMPELVPTWEPLVELAGGSERGGRMLTLYNPPVLGRLLAGGASGRGTGPALVRNYDYAPRLLDRACTGAPSPAGGSSA